MYSVRCVRDCAVSPKQEGEKEMYGFRVGRYERIEAREYHFVIVD